MARGRRPSSPSETNAGPSAEAVGEMIALFNAGRLGLAEAKARETVKRFPGHSFGWKVLGTVLQSAKRSAEAEPAMRRAIKLSPNDTDSHNNLGAILKDLGRLKEAEASYRRALALRPDHAEAHNNLGVVLKDAGRVEDAETSLHRALALRPNYAEAHNNLGIVLQETGRLKDAEACYRRALALRPDYAEAYNNLGNGLKDFGRLEDAEACYRRAVALRPDFSEAHSNLGVILRDSGRLKEAEACYRRALALKPDSAGTHINLGIVLRDQRRLKDAEACYRHALALKPDTPKALNNLGLVLKDLGRLEEAEASFRRALTLKPDYAEAHSNLIFSLNYSATRSALNLREEAEAYGRMVAKTVGAPFRSWRCPDHPKRLRVGMVSGDLRNHPVGHFLEGILSSIDPDRLELIAYPTHPGCDELTDRLRPRFAHWRPLYGRNEVSAGLIHDDGIHVLLDLAGHTAHNRLPVFALRPAPVQASWIGYFASTGVAEMDYLLGDRHVLPVAEEDHFIETPWRLPENYLCFTPPHAAVETAPLPALSPGGITFGSFNNLTKMNDAVVALWARILHAVPGSRLFLKTNQLGEQSVRETTRQRFARHGVPAERLVLEGPSSRSDLLKAYNRVDIALDPFPYTGGVTSAEGLWMGVPLITRRGDRFLSHIGESIVHNAGLADWIAADDDDYVAKAVAYSSDIGRLAELRAGLRQTVLNSPLFDGPGFARHFEAAMWGMWESRKENG